VVVSKMEFYELVRKADGADVDFLREGVRTLAQALMEVREASDHSSCPREGPPGRGETLPAVPGGYRLRLRAASRL
jgi:hypothetical protein